MNSRQQPDNPTDSRGTHTATVVQFGSVQGYAQNGSWHFSVTEPLQELGVTPETIRSGAQASFLFADPKDEILNAVLKTGDDAIGGRTATNARSVAVPGSSLRLSVPEELLTEAGIHCDLDSGTPPLAEFWAGDGVISIRPPTSHQIAHPEDPNTELHLFNTDQVMLHEDRRYRITLSDAVQNAFSDPPTGETCMIQYHINRGEKTDVVQAELLTDGAADTEGDGSLIWSFDHRYRTTVPPEVIEALGYDGSKDVGKPVNVYSSENTQRILLTPPAHDTITVTEPDVIPRYNSFNRYVDAIQYAADDVGEPLSIREYREWNTDQNSEYPSGYTMANSDWKWSELCDEAGVAHGGSK